MEMVDAPVPAVVMVIERGDEVLLCRASEGGGAGSWRLPGGVLRRDETAETTALRCVREQTGLMGRVGSLLTVVSLLEPDGAGSSLLLAYRGRECGGELIPGPGLEEVAFFCLDALPRELGFRNHRVVLERLLAGRPSSWSSPTNP